MSEPEPVAAVSHHFVDGPTAELPVTVFCPEVSGPFRALVWFRGGGWVVGSTVSDDLDDYRTLLCDRPTTCPRCSTTHRPTASPMPRPLRRRLRGSHHEGTGSTDRLDRLRRPLGRRRVATTDDIELEDVIEVTVDGHVLALYQTKLGYFASDGICTHEYSRLCEGFVFDNVIECGKHQGRFDVRTGAAKGGPVHEPIATYPVRVVDGSIEMDLAARAGLATP